MFDASTAPPWPDVLDLPTNVNPSICAWASSTLGNCVPLAGKCQRSWKHPIFDIIILGFFPSKPVMFWCKVFRPFFDKSSLSSGVSRCWKCSKSFVVCDCSTCLPSWSIPVWRAQKQQDISSAEPKLLRWKCLRHNGHAIRLWSFQTVRMTVTLSRRKVH